VLLDVVGLTSATLAKMPRLSQFAARNHLSKIRPAFPAVTCTAQSNYLTGKLPAEHGIVGNGWYHRELAEVHFWKQSNHLVQSPKLWEVLRQNNPAFTCAKLFWWYNMYSSADYSITPRPMYPADGRKIFDIYTWPYTIKDPIKKALGEFPFPAFWGPAAGVNSHFRADAVTRWIAQAAKWIEERYQPSLSLVYLPHLDYNLQRLGPEKTFTSGDLERIEEIVADLIGYFEGRAVQVILVSEYGITEVNKPIHINRLLRKHGWLVLKEELGRELIDYGASHAFAVADHQVAHVYTKTDSCKAVVREVLAAHPDISRVIDPRLEKNWGLDHPRTGDLVACAREDAWFSYYYWADDGRAPDFARTVDIHRKPGYDPVELFVDPAIALPKLKIAWRLLQKKLGLRMLMDVIPLQAELVKGSHGIIPSSEEDYPILISPTPCDRLIDSTDVFTLLKGAIEKEA